MKQFFFEYGLFFAKSVTIVAAIAFIIILIAVLASRKRGDKKETLQVRKLNKKYADMAGALNAGMMEKAEFKKYLKWEKEEQKKDKAEKAQDQTRRNKIFVLDFQGDIRASAVSTLREEITAILTVAEADDEVFLRLESAGGVVHGYGLASSQLMRLRDKKIALTVAVDKVAASGGYMMACVGNQVLAAPFAIIGSVGVIAQLPNFNRVLKKHDVDFEQFTAGEFKRTVTVFGENTEESKAKFREEIEDIHTLFKDFIQKNRPGLDIEKIATGESWPGTRALERNLVDKIMTSDDYLLSKRDDYDIYEVKYIAKTSISERFGIQIQRLLDTVLRR